MGQQLTSCVCVRSVHPDNQQYTLHCGKPCGGGAVSELEIMCDPAGCVFDDTTRLLGDKDRLAFRFAASSNLSGLRWLFIFGASPHIRDTNRTTLLHAACRTGSLPVVKDLVRRGLSVDAADSAGWTPLHVAVCMGRQDVSLYLLQSGAKPQVMNVRGQAPDELCSHRCTKEVVTMYKVHGASRPCETSGFPTRASEFDYGTECTSASTLEFEPFFVPRDPVCSDRMCSEEIRNLGLDLFNRSPGHGIAFLVAVGAVRDYPVEINSFLVRLGGSPRCLGEFLGEDFPIAQTLRLEFLNSLPLLGTGVVSALETAFQDIAVPGGWLKADHLVRGIAHFWWRQHADELRELGNVEDSDPTRSFRCVSLRDEVSGLDLYRSILSTDTLHRLMFSTLMLNRRLQEGHAMTLNQWIELNTGIEGVGNDVPVHVQSCIYKSVVSSGLMTSGRQILPPWSVTPAADGWGCVCYKIKASAQAGWPEVLPRELAESGGVMTAGCSPSMEWGGKFSDDFGETAMVQANTVFEEPTPALSEGKEGSGESAWLRLHKELLILSSNSDTNAAPYAFICLKNAVVKDVDANGLKLVLGGETRAEDSADFAVDDALEVCLLMRDARFQQLQLETLEIVFDKLQNFVAWRDGLVKISARSGRSVTRGKSDRAAQPETEISKAKDTYKDVSSIPQPRIDEPVENPEDLQLSEL